MEIREQRGLVLAATAKIRPCGKGWQVPSQTGRGCYMVKLTGQSPECSCPDWETRREKCKHIYAAIFVMRREVSDGNTTVTETVAVAITQEQRPTYPQTWRAYNAAQTTEKDKFQALLFDLCQGINKPQEKRAGRPSLPMSDAIFSAAFKVYSTFSGRRFMSDLREAQGRGYISRTPHYNSIFNYLENPDVTPILKHLITESSLPLKAIETSFAVDSTGFMTSRFTRWFDHKYGVVKQKQEWVKTHIMCGTKTNVVTAVEIQGQHAHDSRLLPDLVNHTVENFQVSEVLADKGYSSARNLEAVLAVGAQPYIAFSAGTTGRHRGDTWEKMFHYFSFNREQFFAHYHQRSNIESTMMMIKTKFRDHVRSRTDTAMKNEVLCKVLCHNICCLISAMFELGIDPMFSASNS